jgi:hypothetical protein
MATADFEVKQLLKAYRKGLISDELKELLRSLVQDEMSSIKWLKEACALLNTAR